MAPMGAAAPAMGGAPGMAPMGMGGGGVRPKFQGSGGELLVTCLLGMLLCIVTAYIYLPWFLVKQWEFDINNREFTEMGGAGAGMGGPAFQPQMPMQMR